ncbi:metallophosphoesterase family protein [Marisediminicola antarctica]|nr:metallophosphoesterase [Marisediminicola antarctica]
MTVAEPPRDLPTREDPVETLATATRIGFLGDTHGDLEHVLRVSRTMAARGIDTLVVLGDFGFIWPRENTGNILNKLSKRLADRGQSLFFVDGNHEDFGRLLRFPIGADGLRWIRPNLAHIPRGYRTRLVSGRTLAAMGGANSVDVALRQEGYSWWAEEAIMDADLVALGDDPADILIGHDAPMNLPTLDRRLAETDELWPEAGREYAAAGRAIFHRGFIQVQPKLYLGGHYHLFIDDTVAYGTGETRFVARVVILDKNGSKDTISQAILDVGTLELTFFGRDASAPAAPPTPDTSLNNAG